MNPAPTPFQWRPGMLTLDGWRILRVLDEGDAAQAWNMHHTDHYHRVNLTDRKPDLEDPATAGCLMAQAETLLDLVRMLGVKA